MPIRSFKDLEVYQNSYKAAIAVSKNILPRLPNEERFNLVSQLRRACKAVPTLIAEGYAKKHQKKHFQKYLDDAMGKCNEMVVHLEFCKDLYLRFIDNKLCDELLEIYDKTGRQLYNLSKSWTNFKEKR